MEAELQACKKKEICLMNSMLPLFYTTFSAKSCLTATCPEMSVDNSAP